MIRSLLAERHPKTNNITLRRNLEQSDLGAAVRANHNMAWIDVVNPTREEVDWLTELK